MKWNFDFLKINYFSLNINFSAIQIPITYIIRLYFILIVLLQYSVKIRNER